MMTDNLNNAELDKLTLDHDARQGEFMMKEVHELLGRFVCYPNEHAHTAHALWCVHTHLMDRWDLTPRIAFLSPEPASGKSRALEITSLLVPSPVKTVNVSAAYLFRRVGSEEGATILFDEIDSVFGPKAKENEDIRGLLNAGYERGATAGRCVVRGKTIETEDLPAYAAVALAGLGWLPDTIMTRSVVIRMRRRNADQKIEPYRRRLVRSTGERIKGMIEIWAAAQPKEMQWPDMPPEIQDRDADVWESLVAIADAIGGDWPSRCRRAAVSLVAASKEREPSLGQLLLADLRKVLGDKDALSTKDILRGLKEIEESPWRDLKGKELDERGLAHRLRQYEIKSTTFRVDAQHTAKGYKRSDMTDAWSRYLPQSPAGGVTSVTSDTTIHEPLVTDVTQLPGDGGAGAGHKCEHCDSNFGKTALISFNGMEVHVHSNCADAWVADYLERNGETMPRHDDHKSSRLNSAKEIHKPSANPCASRITIR